jgi:hypothetical protein
MMNNEHPTFQPEPRDSKPTPSPSLQSSRRAGAAIRDMLVKFLEEKDWEETKNKGAIFGW